MTDRLEEPISIKSPMLHTTIWFTMSVFVAIIVMACLFKVEVVARGTGKVVPVSRVQVVQPEFDGKITAINVRNGSRVARGDILIEFDTTDANADVNTIMAEIERLTIERARVSALLFGLDSGSLLDEQIRQQVMVSFSESIANDHPIYVEQARLLAAELDDLHAALAQIQAGMVANDRSVDVTLANIARVEATLAVQEERMTIAQDLLDRGTSSRISFIDVQEAFISLENEREIYRRELDQKRSQVTSLLADERSIVTGRRSLLLERRSEIQARLAMLDEQLRSSERRMRAAKLVAPMDGIVDQLEVFTIGAVAPAGEEILRVVPEDQNIEVIGVFTNNDIGFVEIGQQVNINLDAYPSERFGFIRGRVLDVAADSTEISEGKWSFEVRITPDESEMISGLDKISLLPGMTAVVDITTDKRRLISYFFAPIVDTVNSALGER